MELSVSLRNRAAAFLDLAKKSYASDSNVGDATKAVRGGEALEKLAKSLKEHNSVIRDIQHGRLLMIAKLGELLPATPKKETGRGNKVVNSAYHFTKPTLAAYRKVAKYAERIGEYIEWANESDGEVSMKGFIHFVGAGGTRHSSGESKSEWYTPADYVERCRKTMGEIDLDPASSDFAQNVVGSAEYYTAEEDGLSREWHGRVFLNPPYQMPDVSLFVGKLCESVKSQAISQAILLTNNATDTDWWQSASTLASAICFTDGRISFYNQSGEHTSPTTGQTFCYFGTRTKSFFKNFDGVGICLVKL